MFEELYAPLPDVDAYLERIAASRRTPSIEYLDELIWAHLTHVPFEALDVFEDGEVPNLATEALAEKVVTRRRGGYCFELNKLFTFLLRELGFECTSLSACVLIDGTLPAPPMHRGIVVEFDGKRRFCDVGYGGPSPAASIPLDGSLTETPTGTFKIVQEGEWFIVERHKGDEVLRTIAFKDLDATECDFIAPNYFCSQNPETMFTAKRVVNIVTETGSAAIDDDVLRIRANGDVSETTLQDETELAQALVEHFGIEYM